MAHEHTSSEETAVAVAPERLPDDVDVARGLTADQVAARIASGQTNDVPDRASRSVKDIIRGNVFTRINAILTVLLVIVLATGSIIDGMFGLLIIANSGIGIIQEIRAKRTLDALAIVSQAKPMVRRDGVAVAMAPKDVVLDDIIELGSGDQIVVDGEVVSSAALEVDESLLTGEADPVHKASGQQVLSGSFVAAGSGAYRATKVGGDAYAAKLAEEASKFTLVHSELRSGIDKILKFITYLMIPAGALIIFNQLFTIGLPIRPALNGMVAALVPMVPEGLVLMTSIAFAVGVIRLGKRQCLVQELPAIEGLARVDVVCADKTGTLTENGMRLSEVDVAPGGSGGETAVKSALSAMAASDPRPQRECPGDSRVSLRRLRVGGRSDSGGAVLLGEEVERPVVRQSRQLGTRCPGRAARSRLGNGPQGRGSGFERTSCPHARQQRPPPRRRRRRPWHRHPPEALVVLEQKVRPDAQETLEYFASQKVAVKVISGDNAVSVGAVAGSLGLEGGDRPPIDARELPSDQEKLADTLDGATTFGRVRPDQKREMVAALQSRGHTVAMTGDGVNDVLALKDADIGVSMGVGQPGYPSRGPDRAAGQQVRDAPVRRRGRPPSDRQHRACVESVPDQDRLLGGACVPDRHHRRPVPGLRLRTAAVPVPAPPPRHDRSVVHDRYPGLHLVSGTQQRARANRFRLARDASGVAVGPDHRHHHVHLLRIGLPRPGPDGNPEDPGRNQCAHHVDHDRRVGSGVVARPYVWWKLVLIGGSVAGYLILFALPFTREFFKLDPSNVAATTLAITLGAIGVVLVELSWWISARLHGEKRKMFATPDDLPGEHHHAHSE